MDATTSNRLSRGLLAASQGVNQMIQIRMQMADKLYREQLVKMQMQQHAQDRADTQSYRTQTLTQKDTAERAREAEAAARQKTTDANSASLIQSRAADLKVSQARLGVEMQGLEVTKQKLAQSITAHADQMSADKLKEVTGALGALNARIKNLQEQAATAQKATQNYGGDPASIAKAKTLYDSTMGNIQQLNQQAAAYTDHINSLTGVQPPAATPKPKIPIGAKMMKTPAGGFMRAENVQLPPGVTGKEVPQGTPLNQMEPYDYFSTGAPGAIPMPSAAQQTPPPPASGD